MSHFYLYRESAIKFLVEFNLIDMCSVFAYIFFKI